MQFVTSRTEALDKLNTFIERHIINYNSKRNFDFGATSRTNVSCLSPYITHRLITEYETAKLVLKKYPFQKVDKFIQEIFWRVYWKGWLELRPKVWSDFIEDLKIINENDNYLQAINGETEIECFNDWVNELKNFNYLHNHTRMWFASIWIYTLNLPWQLGAEFFMNHLLDADPASNTLSWRWVAGLHTKNKHYFASAENIKKFTNNKYYPKGQVNFNIVESSGWKSYNPIDLNIKKFHSTKKVKYLLIHENDLSLKNLPCSDFLFIQKESIKTIKRAAPIHAFIDKALKSFEQNINKSNYKKIIFFSFNDCDNIEKYLDANESQSIYSPYPSVGYVYDVMKNFEKNKRFKFEFINSEWDSLFWPHAKKGFFKLKKQIKPIIKDLHQPSFNF